MKKHTILVIDDEESTCEFITVHLSSEGYEVLTAMTVDDAIQALVSHTSISLIICDISMPKKDGFDFMRYLCNNLRFASIPLIFSTSRSDEITVTRAKSMGARGYLVKPYVGQTLLEKVRAILESRKGTVLIVSYDELGMNIMARSIFRANYNPLTTGSVTEAKHMLAERQIDILITDATLPDLSGLELMAFAKEQYHNIPVIIILGKQDHITVEGAIAAGADDVIRKPFFNTSIVAKIESVLIVRRNTALREIGIIERVKRRARKKTSRKK